MKRVAPAAFRVLFVCTGNVCRSPQVEALWRERFGEVVVRLSSAGTHALVDEPMPQQSQVAAVAWGVDPLRAAGHRARQLSAELLADTDLVIALTRAHRAEVVRTLPATNRRTVTLREAARLLESVCGASDVDVDVDVDIARLRSLPVDEALRELVTLGLAERGAAPGPDDAADDDVVDPYQRNDDIYALSSAQIFEATHRIEAALNHLARRS
jgi:protein-tyrosine phosphatase